jgi:hypothetical protein
MISYRQLLGNRYADNTALSTFTTEASLLSGFQQPVLWHPHLDLTQIGRQFRLGARGVISTHASGSPTFTFRVYLGSTKMTADNQASPAGTVVGVSPALVGGVSFVNTAWSLELFLTLTAAGLGTSKATIQSAGTIISPAFTTYVGDLVPTQQNATWTATSFDSSVDNFFQISCACSASQSDNAVQLKQWELEALN